MSVRQRIQDQSRASKTVFPHQGSAFGGNEFKA
jgi:hypothetical protein